MKYKKPVSIGDIIKVVWDVRYPIHGIIIEEITNSVNQITTWAFMPLEHLPSIIPQGVFGIPLTNPRYYVSIEAFENSWFKVQ